MKNYLRAKTTLLNDFGLSGFADCITGEMYSRPVPHVFRTEQTRALTSLYEKRGPLVLERLLTRIRAPLQPFNKTSRLGFPFFDTPDSERRPGDTKKNRLMPWFRRMEEEGVDAVLQDCFIIMNVRLQAEPRGKKRAMLFVDGGGNVYEKEVDDKSRMIEIEGYGKYVGSRTRLVFNMPVANLYKQVLDTAIHNELLLHPAFHHNMYSSAGVLPVFGSTLFFDVKHFERHTASVARIRAKLIGGMYDQIVEKFTAAPFLAPDDQWKNFFFLWPDRANGWSDQFASGDSAVAPLQKEAFACLYSEFAERNLGIAPGASVDWVFNGGDKRLTIRNYGDDNALSGDPAVLKDVFSFLQEYLHVEMEDPPKFLGFLWRDGKFKLGVESYLTKTYLHERRPYSNFREFPCFGWVEKRKVYEEYGVPELVASVFPRENFVLEGCGLPWSRVLEVARKESIEASMMGRDFSPSYLLDKDYLMTAEEKVRSGDYEGLEPEETKPMIQKLLGPQWKGRFA